MSAEYGWDGPVLKGPIDTNNKYWRLPAGPASLPPFSSSDWQIGFYGKVPYAFNLKCGSKPVFQPHTTCRVRIINHQDPSNPPAIDLAVRAEDFRPEDDTAILRVPVSYEAHLAAGSTMEMLVLLGDKSASVENDAQTAAAFLTGLPRTASRGNKSKP